MNRRFDMGLGQQFADLDRAYRNCCQDKLTLLGRCAELEELVNDYEHFVGELDIRYGYGAIRAAERNELLQRARALMHEGQAKEEHDA